MYVGACMYVCKKLAIKNSNNKGTITSRIAI